MALILNEDGHLHRARHKATAAEVEATFVHGAPFPERRATIWRAFLAWHALVKPLLPGARVWLDGGFVTYKTWAEPHDVDVVIIADLSVWVARDQVALWPLLTDNSDPNNRLQPMSGLVDAFAAAAVQPDLAIWADTWTSVMLPDRTISQDRRKGFVEVIGI